jgi:hypothetical protein
MTYYYRYLKAGDVATKALLDDRELLSAFKNGNQTVNNTTTNVTDSALTLPLAANATYHVSAMFIVYGPTAADWKALWTFPSGAAGIRFTQGPSTATTTVRNTQIKFPTASLGTSLTFGTDGSEPSAIREDIWLDTSSTAGNLTLTWAQAVATVGDTRVERGSFMTAYRVV